MPCDISAGRLDPCKQVGGIKEVYFINWDSSFFGAATFDVDDQITALTATAYAYEVRGGNTFEEANESTETNSFWTTTGTVLLNAQDLTTRKQMKLMSYGRKIVMTLDFNGNYKIYGLENGCDVAVNTSSGAAMGDFNGYTLTITAKEASPAFFVDSAAIGLTLTITPGV